MINKAVLIDGWMSTKELLWLADRAKSHPLIIEVGCYLGRSTRALGDNCLGTVYAIDPYSGPIYFDSGEEFKNFGDVEMKQFLFNMEDLIDTMAVKYFRTTLKNFNILDKADFIFLDGDHKFESVMEDIDEAMKRLKSGGLLAGHDYTHTDWPGVRRAVDEVFPKVDLCESIWWVNL